MQVADPSFKKEKNSDNLECNDGVTLMDEMHRKLFDLASAHLFETNLREQVSEERLKTIQIEDGEIKRGVIDVLVNKDARLSPARESFLLVIKKHFNGNFYGLPAQ